MLRTDDGVVINVINKGVACRSTDGQTVSFVRCRYSSRRSASMSGSARAPLSAHSNRRARRRASCPHPLYKVN
jgi:hypothetical protein